MNQESKQGTSPFIGYYGYWVILTYLSVASAVVGIYLAFVYGNIRGAIICLMFSGLCDMFDGSVAKRKERSERELNFGVQIDALSDIISFGAFPVVIGFALFTGEQTQMAVIFNIVAFCAYLLTALIRLGYFNAIETELLRKEERSDYFQGLPVTSIALLIPLYYCLHLVFDFSLVNYYPVLLLITALFFILRIKVPKPRGVLQAIVGLVGLLFLFLIIIL